ncbi:VWA domain-containing protein [Chondromyces apiculatus]|uniref:BatA aerotolerance operon protein n=1 Tax=Chondromyces apiculatus DSM 436 TaxID=1192034 RepID=A0A017T633_9BACT|nr:VWA domain-containing protein [Chondromyces apiculatus]EYF04482.1 BatA aerotolerance operon protein [Chondromyces apiculatus DSM 436]
MSTAKRVILAVLATLLIAGAALVYPWLARREAWIGATWQQPWLLLGLLVVPVVWYWGIFAQDARKPRLRLGTVSPLLTGPRGIRSHLRDLPGAIRAIAVAMLVLAMGRPVSVLRDQQADDKGIDIVVALDLSGSMRAVLDAKQSDLPGAPRIPKNKRLTRLDVAKLVLQDFIGRRRTDRIGVIVFGKAAYVLSPPTMDYPLLSQLVSKMSLSVIDGSGTAIGDALGTAAARLRRSDAISKVIILITDGDSNAGSISPEYAADLAAGLGAKVHTIQIGTADEVDVEDGVDLFGQPRYARQRFPVNPELLRKIAQKTGGEAYVATDAKALSDSMHDVLDTLEKTRFEASIASFEDLFPLLLLPGAVLVGLDALLRAWLLRRFP